MRNTPTEFDVRYPPRRFDSRPISIVIADDHDLFREGLAEILSRADGLVVVGQASTGEEATRVAEDLRPDLVLLDVEMPGQSARVTIRRLIRDVPRTRIVVLTMHQDAILERELLDAGASVYLNKAIGSRELVAAVRQAMSAGQKSSHHRDADPIGSVLSPRELDVMRLIASANSNQAIAQELCIAQGTVKRHVSSIFAKLGVTSRMGAVVAARLRDLIS